MKPIYISWVVEFPIPSGYGGDYSQKRFFAEEEAREFVEHIRQTDSPQVRHALHTLKLWREERTILIDGTNPASRNK